MKILVAMSGGVDSSVAALLLKDQGFSVSAVYMKNWINEENVFGDCPWEQDITDARASAAAIGIDFEVANFIKEYRERVVHYLVEGYRKGITPNPDVMCNREMKFGVLLDYALENGFDAVATGHYCQKQENPDGTSDLFEGCDKNKDQSYFLALLSQKQLQRACFPIGHLTKPEVRKIAIERKLPNAQKKDSQGICFIGKVKINDFLHHFISDNPGEIVTPAGKHLGEHKGLHRYTLGQRRGINIPSNTDNKFYVVVGKDIEKNQLIVAFESQDTPGLYGNQFTLYNLSYTNRTIDQEGDLLAKPRYRDPSQKIHFKPAQDNKADIQFQNPQRALATGQVCALYDGEKLLGGGIYH